MAFPTTGVLDTFSGDLSNWTVDLGTLAITGGQLYASSYPAYGWWNPTTFGPDSEVYISVPTVGPFSIYVRFNPATVSGYGLYHDGGAFGIVRLDSGTPTLISSEVYFTLLANDKLGLEVIGDAFNAYRYTSGAWNQTPFATGSDNIYTGAGRILTFVDTGVVRLDDFGGGTVSAGSAKSLVVPSIAGRMKFLLAR